MACAQAAYIDGAGMTVGARIRVPEGFVRIHAKEGSFAAYLRSLPLLPLGAKVRYFDGRTKPHECYVSVVDMEVGNSDLLQCADAVMKLRAEYLYGRRRFSEIVFHITDGTLVEFSKWTKGLRPRIKNGVVEWRSTGRSGSGRPVFDEYLRFLYAYAGTLSLSRELAIRGEEGISIGDVFIQGGSPGHAVIVVDMAVHARTNEKIFLLAQSYMPAQEIQILKSAENVNPWYRLPRGGVEPSDGRRACAPGVPRPRGGELVTPEWVFPTGSLKRF
jgi:hypothetical protein